MTEVVQRLVGHPAGHRAVADDGDDVTVVGAAEVAGDGEAVGVAEDRRGMRVLDEVVGALGARGIARQAARLAQRGEAGPPPGDDLVHVRLVAGVPEQDVAWRVEDPVQRQRQLDDTEVGAEVAGVLGDGGDDEVTDLAGQRGQVVVAQIAEVARLVDLVEPHRQRRYLAPSASEASASRRQPAVVAGAAPATKASTLATPTCGSLTLRPSTPRARRSA